jgi:hypothetical protein
MAAIDPKDEAKYSEGPKCSSSQVESAGLRPCPHCGYCPSCGRGPQYWPVYPTQPSYPFWAVTSGSTTHFDTRPYNV